MAPAQVGMPMFGVREPSRQSGLTIIEVMIVIGLMGILSTIAVASYSGYVDNARRADGVAVLEESRFSMEQFYAKNFNYAGAVAGDDYPAKSPKDGADIFYTINLEVLDDGKDYRMTALPQGRHADDECGSLTITRTGSYSNTGALSVSDCF